MNGVNGGKILETPHHSKWPTPSVQWRFLRNRLECGTGTLLRTASRKAAPEMGMSHCCNLEPKEHTRNGPTSSRHNQSGSRTVHFGNQAVSLTDRACRALCETMLYTRSFQRRKMGTWRKQQAGFSSAASFHLPVNQTVPSLHGPAPRISSVALAGRRLLAKHLRFVRGNCM